VPSQCAKKSDIVDSLVMEGIANVEERIATIIDCPERVCHDEPVLVRYIVHAR
jgi:hypothetical protein